MGVLTAVTMQTESHFSGIDWIRFDKIKEQLLPLLDQYKIRIIKIGIVESLETLLELVHLVKAQQEVRIIWDPVMASSTGFVFHKAIDQQLLSELLSMVYLLTPNLPEAMQLAMTKYNEAAAEWLASMTNVLLKGGHSETHKGTDYLWESGNKTTIKSTILSTNEKHGSGCILSSAIAAGLASGKDLYQSCISAKHYIGKILNSNPNLLAYHA